MNTQMPRARVFVAAMGLGLAFGACSHEDTIKQDLSRVLPDEVGGSNTGVGGSAAGDTGSIDAGDLDSSSPLLPDASVGVDAGAEPPPPPQSVCGDGERSGAEECDDGDLANLDGCSSACRSELCGNGRVDPGETCDRTHATCVACQTVIVTPPSCGNGKIEAGETCDDGNTLAGDRCSPACLNEVCGDSQLDQREGPNGKFIGETCEPPAAGLCDPSCQEIKCGDRRLREPETCDDGNTAGGDGCSPACRIERCGDGVVNQPAGVEQCDDPATPGNCDGQCRRVECGNGVKQGQEECDGEPDCTDGCLSIQCNNGRLDPGEDCETPGVGLCDSRCQAARVECGDRVKHPSEECDDGNRAYGDGCSPICQIESCGNGRTEAPRETCDPPGTAVCGARCRTPRCGDGFIDLLGGEECDDGNGDSGDGCGRSCRLERCGNGRLDPPNEQCDPPGPNCNDTCRVRPRTPLELERPLSGGLFQLDNPGFLGSLEPWRISAVAPAQGAFSVLDAAGAPGSGSLQLSLAPRPTSVSPGVTPPLAVAGALVRASQCVRTAPGSTYRASIQVNALEPVAPVGAVLDLGVRFHAGAGCSGAVLNGVTTAFAVSGSWDWSALPLPPPSPVPGHQASFVAPQGAGSMELSFELWQEPGQPAAAVAIDGVELVRLSPRVCLNGVPEDGEDCEPNVTPGCTNTCRLPALCGDGVEGLGECGNPNDARACPRDCPAAPANCGDGRIASPEECDPPGTVANEGICSAACTLRSAHCGNGRREGAEQCDPPDGVRCNESCRTISCGNGQVEAPEECERGQAGCSDNCRRVSCGDGVLQGPEECDPPNPLTWCSSTCRRQDPKLACGNGRLDTDLEETCDPPSFSDNCGLDCKTPVCGDGKVGGLEQCDPPRAEYCGTVTAPGGTSRQCQLLDPDLDQDCQRCLGEECGDGPENLFAGCFALEGVAQAGPAQGTPLRELCAEVVECLRETACAVDLRAAPSLSTAAPDPASCYCGKGLLAYGPSTGATFAERDRLLRACRDGVPAPEGPCLRAFERAAETTNPAGVLAAMHPASGQPALRAALRLAERCGPEQEGGSRRACRQECSIQRDCGNGIIEAGELCDPGLASGVPGPDPELCHPELCAIEPCGNGVVDATWPYSDQSQDPVLKLYTAPSDWEAETCDIRDPYTNQGEGTCDSACQLKAECGDGKLSAAVEACDPGPNGDWAECCRLGSDPAQLAGCDADADGQIEASEACMIPSKCGDEKRTGLEECDPPEPGKCSDQCRAIGPCAECTTEYCYEKDLCSGATVAPGFAAACRSAYQCVLDNDCGQAPLFACVCGVQSSGQCNQLGGDGPCRERWLDDAQDCLSTGATPGLCMTKDLYNLAKPSGVAGALAKCQQDNCIAECFGEPL